MLIELMRLVSPGRYSDDESIPADAMVTDDGEPEITDDGALVRYEQAVEQG
ncbi:hypothetical protein ACF8O8_25665 [Pseudomonas sp. TYF_14]|uniref:hypothetical protein n=1 Tax=Pseudomonas sp. TYF_14 TaxID=3367193 RepID=UPI00370CB0CB